MIEYQAHIGVKIFWMEGTKKSKSWKNYIRHKHCQHCTQTHLKLGQRLQSAKATFWGDGSYHHPTFGLHRVKMQRAVHCCTRSGNFWLNLSCVSSFQKEKALNQSFLQENSQQALFSFTSNLILLSTAIFVHQPPLWVDLEEEDSSWRVEASAHNKVRKILVKNISHLFDSFHVYLFRCLFI